MAWQLSNELVLTRSRFKQMQAAVDARLAAVLGAAPADRNAAPADRKYVASCSDSPLESELRSAREQRSVLEARLRAQRSVTLRLRDENEALAAQLATTTQRLRSTARALDEMRQSLEETDALDARMVGALARKQEAASATMCRALQARVRELERELSELRTAAGASPSTGAPSSARRTATSRSLVSLWDFD